MTTYLETPDGFAPWSGGLAADGNIYPRDFPSHATALELSAAGLFDPDEPVIPAGKREVSRTLVREGNGAIFVVELEDVPPRTPADITLTRRQVRRAIAYSVGLDAVNAAIMALPAGEVRDLALVDWEDSPVYVRSHPLFNQLSIAIGITPAQIDALWLWAESFDA